MKYAIVGTGALGGYYGGLLARSGLDVHFLCHHDAEHIRSHGLWVESCKGDFRIESVQAYSSTNSMPECDVVVVCLKSTQNHLLVDLLPPLIGPNSTLVVLQNGLHVEEESQRFVPLGSVIGGCCFLCSNKVGPGHIRHLDYGRITLGIYRGRDNSLGEEQVSSTQKDRLQRIGLDFAQAGIDLAITDSLEEARWRKLMWNIPFNGLSVVLNATTREIVEDPKSRELASDLMSEVRSIAVKSGHSIEESFIDKLMEDTRKMVPYDSSMRLDFLAGRTMEIEAIFGNPIRAAERNAVPCKQLKALYRQLISASDVGPA